MNVLPTQKRVQVIAALVEGNSICATGRITGVAKNTIVKLLADVGKACQEYQRKTLRDLPCKRIQVDEIWSFCYAKQKNVPADKQGRFGYGDVWTWVALDADTKLVPCWLVGTRDGGAAFEFIEDLRKRLANRIQLTSDGHRVYAEAVEGAFGGEVDYAQLVKMYGPDKDRTNEVRYGQADREISSALTRKATDLAQGRAERLALRQRKGVLRTDDWLDEYLGFAGSEK